MLSRNTAGRGEIFMDSGGLGFWRTVCASILAGVAVVAIVAVASRAFGFHHQAWTAIVAAAGWCWRVLTFLVPVPAMILALVALWVWRKIAAGGRIRPTGSRPSSASSPDNSVTLSANETLVVCLLARADGAWMRPETMASKLNLPNLLVEQALERLLARGLILHQNHVLDGPQIRLSSRGRDLAIDESFVPNRGSIRI